MKMQITGMSMLKMVILAVIALIIVPNSAQAQRARLVKKKVVQTKRTNHRVYVPKRGTYVKVVPTGATVISYRNTRYRLHNGIFYKPYNGRFVVTAPPIGIRIVTLPLGYRSVAVRNRNYYYHAGIFYIAVGSRYEVVKAPVGALVDYIPDENQEVLIKGDTYYVLDDVQYKAVIRKGEVWYEVIKIG